MGRIGVALLVWVAVLLVAIAAIQWGARRVASLLEVTRARFGLAETAAGALLGIATASPETSINVASVVFGWPEIGLGTALGSNLPALPLILSIGYVSMRWHARRSAVSGRPPPIPFGSGAPALELKKQSVVIQAVPYLLVTLLVAALTLPPAWAGLQPVDGAILLAAFTVFLGQAVLRKRGKPNPSRHLGGALGGAAIGVGAIALGAVASVWSTDTINQALGISPLVGGLFITGLLCALPESFAAWPLARDGRATATASTAIADGTISLSLAFAPLAFDRTEIGDVALYVVNLAGLTAMILVYIALNRRKPSGYATGTQVLVFDAAYLVYLCAVVWVLWR